ncbi:MAG TPA: hypothetical protein PLN69_11770 [bacterium]|nr:hypothetical protein [bacterium]
MKKGFNRLLAVAVFLGMVFACVAAAAGKLPTGVVEFETTGNREKDPYLFDSGYPTTAAAVQGDYLWLGRNNGLRRYHRETGEWTFFAYPGTKCPGKGTINVVSEPPYIWARLTNTGTLCRLDPRDGTWYTPGDWTVISHRGQGRELFITEETFTYAANGSPDWQGVNIIDRKLNKWVELHSTKPISSMLPTKRYFWLGVPEGILRINRVTEEYTYYQPEEIGFGALVKDIEQIPGGLAFATMGNRIGVLGDKVRVFKDYIRVYNKDQDSWQQYDKNERERLIRDIESGKTSVNYIKTTPGVLILKDEIWTLIGEDQGLDHPDTIELEKDDSFLYICTSKGINVRDIETFEPVDINPHIYLSLLHTWRLLPDGEYYWAFNKRGLFRVDRKSLFSSPR